MDFFMNMAGRARGSRQRAAKGRHRRRLNRRASRRRIVAGRPSSGKRLTPSPTLLHIALKFRKFQLSHRSPPPRLQFNGMAQ